MKYIKLLLINMCILITLLSCSNVPSTGDLDRDIEGLNKQIKITENEANRYSGGLLKILIDLRKDILTNTKLMLEQKRSGLNRFIHINYTIDGKKYFPPNDKNELLKNIHDNITNYQKDIVKARKEGNRYSGGVIKVLIDVKAATLENSLAFLKQRELLLKYDIPFYSVIPKSEPGGETKQFKSTPGKDVEKF